MKHLTLGVILTLLLFNVEVTTSENGPQLDCSDFFKEKSSEKPSSKKVDNKKISDFLNKFAIDDDEFNDSTKDDNEDCPLSISPENLRNGFDIKDVKKAIQVINCNPSAVNHLHICQLDHTLRWKDLVNKLDSKIIKEMYMNDELGETIKAKIPYATLASFIQIREDFASFLAPGTSLQSYVKDLINQRSFVNLLEKDFIAKSIENSENIRRLMDTASVKLGLELYPDFYQGLGNNSLSDEKFLEILPCNAFKKAAEDNQFLHKISPNVLYKMNLFSNIPLDDGSKTDFYHCLGKDIYFYLFVGQDKLL